MLKCAQMVTYEITAEVDADLAPRFEAYMIEHHITDVLETRYFTSAVFSRSGERYRIRYQANHLSKIDEYLEMRAPMLRADLLQEFPTGIRLSREIWEVLTEIEAAPQE